MSRKYGFAFVTLAMLVFLLAACTPVEFSPDGKHIIFCWSVDGRSGSLFTMNTDGTHLQALPGGAEGLLARWSPSGRFILFGDTKQDLKVVDTNTSTATYVGSNASLTFAWKEDSRQFAALFVPTKGALELRRYRWPEGTLLSRMPLPPRVSASSFSQMTWLRGREDVAFIGTDPNHRSSVYIVSDAGVREPPKSFDALGLGQTVDGSKLVWACPGADYAKSLLTLYEYDVATGRVVRLPFPSHLAPINTDPARLPTAIESVAFAPDNKWMAIVVDQQPARVSGTAPAEISDTVYVARMDGSKAHLVQQVAAVAPRDTLDMKEELIPSWSHDGARLAVLQWGQRRTSITLYNADGSGRLAMPLPAHPDDAMVQRIRTYVSRHYPRSLQRTDAKHRSARRR